MDDDGGQSRLLDHDGPCEIAVTGDPRYNRGYERLCVSTALRNRDYDRLLLLRLTRCGTP